MTATLVVLFGVLLVLFGGLIGAELQDRVHRQERMRWKSRRDDQW